MLRALCRVVLVAAAVLAIPSTASAEAWRPPGKAPVALLPLAPVDVTSPLVFPSAGAPRIVVGVVAGADLDAVADELRPYARSLQILRAVGEVSILASNGSAVADLAARDPRIEFADPDRTLDAQADQFDTVDPSTGILYDWQYDAVEAGPAIAAVGGGSSFPVAVVDSGIDLDQPDLAGRILPGYDATGTDGQLTDDVGHGTFVAGLISMVDGNGIGGKGIAGDTSVLPIRASLDTGFREAVTIAGITWAADHGAGVINLSFGGAGDDAALDRAIDYAASKNVLVVAAAGNDGGSTSNPVDYPAGYVGGTNGGWSIGLSVGATMPNNQIAPFSSHNPNVSISAPGAGGAGCAFGDLSTLPTSPLSTEWDDAGDPCNTVLYTTVAHLASAGRWGYGEGTSFAAPIVSAVAALTRQANPLLTASQVADVLRRSATQTMGVGWNPYTGAGVVNAAAAVALARAYDTTPPVVSFSAVPRAGGIETDLSAADAVDAGKTLAGGVTFALDASKDGVSYVPTVSAASTEIHQLVPTTGPTWLRATVCDANHNCAQAVDGPLTALVPAPVTPKPSLELRVLRRMHRKLKVRVALGKGASGKAVVQLESWTGKAWRAFDRITVTFGMAVVRTEHVSRSGRYRLRARLAAGPSYKQTTSTPVTLRVK